MAKRKKQTKKLSIASILGLVLLGLVAVGVVANVIKSNVKEKEEDGLYETATVEIGGYKKVTIEFEYTEGMTWEEIIEHNEDLQEIMSVTEDGYVSITGENLTPQGGNTTLLGVVMSTDEGYPQTIPHLATEVFDVNREYTQYME